MLPSQIGKTHQHRSSNITIDNTKHDSNTGNTSHNTNAWMQRTQPMQSYHGAYFDFYCKNASQFCGWMRQAGHPPHRNAKTICCRTIAWRPQGVDALSRTFADVNAELPSDEPALGSRAAQPRQYRTTSWPAYSIGLPQLHWRASVSSGAWAQHQYTWQVKAVQPTEVQRYTAVAL